MVVVTTKFYKAIPMVGVNVCAALKHTLLMVGFYFIRSFLSMWCPTDFAARILQIRPVPVEKVVFYVSTWQRVRICGLVPLLQTSRMKPF
jgi:hypothetical protein